MAEWNPEWHPFYIEDDFGEDDDRTILELNPDLKDHCYYLVTDVRFGTPMKAKWHAEGNWELRGVPEELGWKSYLYPWDEPYTIIAWCELPDVYRPSREQMEKIQREVQEYGFRGEQEKTSPEYMEQLEKED